MLIILQTLLTRDLSLTSISLHNFHLSNPFELILNLSALLYQHLSHIVILLSLLEGNSFQEFTGTSHILGRCVFFGKISRLLYRPLYTIILVFKVVYASLNRFPLLTLLFNFLPHIFER